MRILHISDTHGRFPKLEGEFDVIVHTGDLMKNHPYNYAGNPSLEAEWQEQWLVDNGPAIKDWLLWPEVPVLFVSGNHDYAPAARILEREGILPSELCYELDDQYYMLEFAEDGGLRTVGFYGFPWTPEFCGWNWMDEDDPAGIGERLVEPVELMEDGLIDVFCAHGPAAGLLDTNAQGVRCGSFELGAALRGARRPPELFLHGHIHEARGIGEIITPGGHMIRVSNAACTQRIVEI